MTDAGVPEDKGLDHTSSSLLRRVRFQDRQAWERLVDLYSPLVYHWCRRAGLQAADAADLGQEVFTAVARKIGDFRRDQAGQSFRGWLYTITRNKLCDHFRKRQAGPVGAGGDDAHAALMQLPADASSADDLRAEADEKQLLYRRAVDLIRGEFEDRTWQAFWRVVIEGQVAADVAHDLAMTVNAVYLAKSRILRRLREEFAELVEV